VVVFLLQRGINALLVPKIPLTLASPARGEGKPFDLLFQVEVPFIK
jgi:hypothetical protein